MRGAWQLAALAATSVAAWEPAQRWIEGEELAHAIWHPQESGWSNNKNGWKQPPKYTVSSSAEVSPVTTGLPLSIGTAASLYTVFPTSQNTSSPVVTYSYAPSNGLSAPYGNSSTTVAPVSATDELTTIIDYTTIYTTTCPASSVYTSGGSTLTGTYLATSTVTSVYSSTVLAYATSSSLASLANIPTTSAQIAPVSYGGFSSELTSTETIYTIVGVTVTACGSEVADCPATSTYVSQTIVSVGTTIVTGPAYASSEASAVSWSDNEVSADVVSYSSLSGVTESATASDSSLGSGLTCTIAPGTLTNEQQVGNSTWGTLCQSTFPKWLNKANGRPYYSAPWGNKTTKNSDGTVPNDIPNTNVTRYYDFTVSRDRIQADGVLRDVILVNGQFPGPAIEANWGDYIQVTVHNNITTPDEGTALHWHGMLQKKTPWYDGVPGVGQCPIAPGGSFTYRYQAELHGTSWYHAHYSAQYTGGVVGPMIIYGPSSASYDIDIGPVLLSDWYHIPYFSIVSDVVGSNMSVIPPLSDNNLISGRNNFNCSDPSFFKNTELLASNLESNITWTCTDNAPLSKFQFQSGKTHRLRLINHGADGIQKFSIDGHTMTVIAYDYVPIVPYTASVVTIGVAQRADILVTANNNTQSMYWMRSEIAGGVAWGGAKYPLALAAIYYEGADTTATPTTSTNVNSTTSQNDDLTLTTPDYSITPSSGGYAQDLEISLVQNATGSYEWRLNNQTMRVNFNEPLLFKAAAGNVSYPDDPQWNVYNYNQNSSVIFNVTNCSPFTHPFHLHGHNFYVLDEGMGAWNGTYVNGNNPMRRDTQIVRGGGYIVVQMEADNPGVWPFHCHVAWHLSGGLGMNVISKPQDIPAIPDVMPQTCRDWDAYSNSVVVDQIDAGK